MGDDWELVTIVLGDKIEHYPKDCFITLGEYRNSQLDSIVDT